MKPRVIVPLVAGLLALSSSPSGVASLLARSNGVAVVTAQANDRFEPYVAFPVGSTPEAVAIGDLNDDGLNDVALVTGNTYDPVRDFSLFVFLQDRAGALRAPVKYAAGGLTGSGSRSVDVGDVNGDGRNDVVVGRNNASIGVFLQNASGMLNPAVSYATPDSHWVRLGDFNSDGRLDIAAIAWSNNPGGVTIFAQQPDGTLTLAARYTGVHQPWSDPDVGDVNGDGRDDLVIGSGNYGPDISLHLQASGGWLMPGRSIDLIPSDTPNGIAVGDVNGDGRQDVVLGIGGNYPSSRLGIWLQDAAGVLGALTSMPSYDIPLAVEVADIDSDLRRDVIVLHHGWNAIGLYRQQPDGTLAPEERIPFPTETNHNPHAMAVGDVTGDGANDIVIANRLFGLIVLPQRRPSASASRILQPRVEGASALAVGPARNSSRNSSAP